MKDLYVVLYCHKVTTNKPKQKSGTKTSKTQKHKNTKPKTQHKQAKRRRDRCQFMGEIGKLMQEVITLYHLIMVWQNNKRQNNQPTRPYQRVSEATKYDAETRDPPSQDPRDHMAQAVKASQLTYRHFEANNGNAVSQREW